MSALCTICQDNFGEGEGQGPFALECGHMFHSICIVQWFRTSSGGEVGSSLGKCPTCNRLNSFHKVIRVYPTAGDDDQDSEENRKLKGSLREMEDKVTLLELKLVDAFPKLKGSLKEMEDKVAFLELKLADANRKHKWSLGEMERKVTDLESKLAEANLDFRYLSTRYEEESEAHAYLKFEHNRFVDIIGRELENVQKSQEEGFADVDKGLLKLANVVHFCSPDKSKLNVVDEGRDAVLAYAVRRKRPLENISILIWRGADWRHLNKNEQSLLHIAASGGTATTLKFLLEMGELDVNGVDKDGATPLHLVLRFERNGKFLVEKCRLLIKNGAGVGIGISDKKGKTALTLALEHPNKAVKAELKRVLLGELFGLGEEEDGERGNAGESVVPALANNSSQINPNPSRGNMNGRGRCRGRSRGRGRKQPQSNRGSNGMV